MKKLFSLLLTAILIFTACGEKENNSQQSGGDVNWPTKTVTITLPYNAGGDTDTYARLMARKLEEKFGQTFVVVNMTGGSGIVAAKTLWQQNLMDIIFYLITQVPH